MAVFDLFSKRLAKNEGKISKEYIYDKIPQRLRQQIWYIFQDSKACTEYKIGQILCKEYGKRCLIYPSYSSNDLYTFFIDYADYLQALDIIELIAISVNTSCNIDEDTIKELIEDLNTRFKENGIGYQYEGGQIVRLDSTYMHSEVVKPTIQLLNNEIFKGALDEYMKAHEYYKNGDNSSCLNECLKSFESTMKIICTKKGWNYNETDQAKKLISICFENGLIPSYMQNQYTSLQNLLESGVPTNRNKNSGHGQGPVIKEIPDSLARYTLNLTGSNIIFLIEQSGLK